MKKQLIISLLATVLTILFVVLAVRNLSESIGTLYFMAAFGSLVGAAVIWKN